MEAYVTEHYKQAVITCCWVVESGYRELLFAMLEFVPKFYGDEQSTGEQCTRVKNRRIYYIRHVMGPADAYEWYKRSLQTQALEMPWDDPNKRIFFCSRGASVCLKESVPFPKTLYNDDAPFRTKLWRGAQMHHLMQGERQVQREAFIASDTAIAEWIEERLLWALHKHVEYLGSLNLVLPNPYYGHMHLRLVPKKETDEADRVQLLIDRDCSGAGLRLLFQEKNLNEHGRIIEHELPLEEDAIMADGIVDKIGYCVFDKGGRVIDREDETSFLRKIVINYICKDGEKDITCRDGSVQTISPAVCETQELEDKSGITDLKLHNVRTSISLSREHKEEAKDQHFFYRQGGVAEKFLREIMLTAFKHLTIIDPYFSEDTAKMFLANLNHGIDVDVVCTADGFKTSGTAESFQKTLDALKSSDCRINTIVAGNGQLHDRFLVIDDKEVWMLGSSMKTLGDSLSVIVKLKDPATVIRHLSDVVSSFNAPSLEDWIRKNSICLTKTSKVFRYLFRFIKPMLYSR